MDTPLQYFVYLRKSSEGDEKQALSCEAQEYKLRPLIEKESLIVSDIIEESHSAKLYGQRKIFNDMVMRINKGEANAILIWNTNRLSRNAGDAGIIIDLIDRGLLLEIKTPEKAFRNYPQDKFFLNLLCSQAKLENDNKGADVKRNLEMKARNGWRPGMALPGYLSTPHKKKGFKTIEVDPESFQIVKRFFKKLLDQEATVQELYLIARDQYGLKNASKKKTISRAAFYKLFKNPFYSGEFEYPIGSGKWYKGKHKPMITKEEFLRLQSILTRKITPKKLPTKTKLPYRRLFKCGECGMSITGSYVVKKQKNGNVHNYQFYHCTKKSRNVKCSQKTIRQEAIEKKIEETLKQIWIPASLSEWIIERMDQRSSIKQDNHKTEISDLKKKIITLENRINNLIDLRLDNEISKVSYIQKKQDYEHQITELREQLNSRKKLLENSLAEFKEDMNFAQTAFDAFKNGNYSARREIIQHIGSNLLLMDKKLIIKPKKELLAIQKSRKSVEDKIGGFKPLFSLNKGTLDTIHAKSPIKLPERD